MTDRERSCAECGKSGGWALYCVACMDKMARDDDDTQVYRSELKAAVKAAVAAEREACAKVCDAEQKKNEDNGQWMWEAKRCAIAIRARGDKP